MSVDKKALLRAVSLVRPALHTKNYIPALTHILLQDGRATAYNDIAAISVPCVVPVAACLPGELLVKALSGFSGDAVAIQSGKAGEVVLKSGRSTIKLATLDAADFPFVPPDPNEGEATGLRRDVITGLERCLLSVGNDPTHPAQMGVTLEAGADGKAVLYSTDNATVSRYKTDTKIALPGGAPVLLPRFFCEQLIALAKAHADAGIEFVVYPGALVAEIGEGEDMVLLFTKTPYDAEPLDFGRIISRHVPAKLGDRLTEIPDAFDGALQRSLLVSGGEALKRASVSVVDGALSMTTSCGQGTADDDMPFVSNFDGTFTVDPALLARGAKTAALVGFTDGVTLLASKDTAFLHIVAHCAA